MKAPKSLKEVWKWKHKCYLEYKDKPLEEIVKLINKNAEEVERKYNLKLRAISSIKELDNDTGNNK